MKKRRELKKHAKQTLHQEPGLMILITCLKDAPKVIVGLLTFFLGLVLISGPMEYGMQKSYYRILYGDKTVKPIDIADGFRERYSESFLAGLIQSLVSAIPQILLGTVIICFIGIVASVFTMIDFIDLGIGQRTMTVSVITIVLIAACDIACIVITLALSMSQYILFRNPELKGFGALTASGRMMRGNKFKLLMLYISFIPWYLLGFITGGIALFYVSPYFRATKVLFFTEIYMQEAWQESI